jgi:Fe2+ transport system protein FeoA
MTLSELPVNSTAIITGFTSDTLEVRRLVSMGFRVGNKVTVIRKIHNEHMIHCRVNTSEFAVRQTTAKEILLR